MNRKTMPISRVSTKTIVHLITQINRCLLNKSLKTFATYKEVLIRTYIIEPDLQQMPFCLLLTWSNVDIAVEKLV